MRSPGGRLSPRGAGRSGWTVGGSGRLWSMPGAGRQGCPGGRPGPCLGQVQREPSRGAGESGGNRDQLRPDRAGGGLGVKDRGQHAGGAGEVERDRGADQPGAVGPEVPGRQMRERTVLQVRDDLLDDCVRAVGLLRLEHRQRAVGEHCVVPVDSEQWVLVAGIGVLERAARSVGR